MALKCLIVLALLSVLPAAFSLPRFLRGRPRGGMLGVPNAHIEQDLPEDQWFTQRLDHFDDANLQTWQQRFFVNQTFYRPGGPVFFMIGGEGEASPVWVVVGSMMKYANLFGAFAVLLEHRFYGKSHPTNDISDENLQYLNSEQALADLANFRQAIAAKYNLTGAKWISFGGSYPGCLSAWFRLKYPHLVHGAVATSGPVLAKLDFTEYLNVVSASLSTTGPQCVQNIAAAVQHVEKMMNTTTGRQELSTLFRLSSSLSDDVHDLANFASTLAGNFMGIVQYNKDNRKFEVYQGSTTANITIDTLCKIMNDESAGEPIQRYADVNTLLMKAEGIPSLDIIYKNLIDELRDVSWSGEAAEGGRQWIYQTCTEFGFFQTSDSRTQPFGNSFPLSFSLDICKDTFGSQFNGTNIARGIKSTNTNYGGKGIAGSKIVFPNGSIDPWHALGIVKNVSDTEHAIFIEGTAHCANMYPDSPSDPPQLIQARLEIMQYIENWISD